MENSNSAVIVKVEYLLAKDDYLNFEDLDIIPYSGKLSESTNTSKAGTLHRTKLNFNIAKVNPEKDQLLKSIANLPLLLKAYDANGRMHYIGDDEFYARLTYEKNLDGKAGSFNGYRCTVEYETPYGSVVE